MHCFIVSKTFFFDVTIESSRIVLAVRNSLFFAGTCSILTLSYNMPSVFVE